MLASARLLDELDLIGPVAIAVSGGVDSVTLAAFAHRYGRHKIEVVHAVSPAVPGEATRLVHRLAIAEGWDLTTTETGEFSDPHYLSNPVNRCYFCKTNLYNRIRSLSDLRIASGANCDDLGDYRPGLISADENGVLHPYILAGYGKYDIRALARELGLGDVAELPGQPCLASRIETGINIDAGDLAFVELAESRITALFPDLESVRCRVTSKGIILEAKLDVARLSAEIGNEMVRLCTAAGREFAGLREYRRGAMFVHT